jgi:ADP-L-glycero-D-manno-heptose 6-epimerase
MSYIVTGGLGFIGSNMVGFLNGKSNYDVVVCDRVRPDRYKNISGYRVSDLIKPDELITYILDNRRNINGIFHLGACSDTMNFTDEVMVKNFEYTRELIDQCIAFNIPLVYASSASVYGTNREAFEHRPTEPLNLYAFSKSMVDQYFMPLEKNLIHLSKDHRPSIIGLRYFNVYGPNERHKGKMASFIFQKYMEMREMGSISLFKPGDQRRDFVHVEDVCKVNWAMMQSKNMGIFNVGTGEAPTFTEVANVIANRVRPEINYRIRYIDFPEELKGRYQDYTCSDNSCLRAIYKEKFLGYEQGINKAIDSYEEGK